jgi:hypothetical protein
MLIIVFILVCVFLDVSYQELGRPIFLEGIVGLIQIIPDTTSSTSLNATAVVFFWESPLSTHWVGEEEDTVS